MKIKVLSPEVVDQIAAGEVVERPSHLVKELVENSLDAGATEVIVDFGLGGRFVKIVDNGSGMSRDDLPQAFLRFATSKIQTSNDIWRLKSFGFRGEALASISSVSQMTLFSSDSDSGMGHRLVCQFGKIGQIEDVSRSRGTTVIVEELFQNVPARLKFMKSDASEAIQIKQVLRAIALSRPDVSFRLMQDNKLLTFWPQRSQWIERIQDVLDVKPLYEGNAVRGSIKSRAFFSSPDETNKTSKMIWVFAQGRYIQDKSVQAAVMEAYRNLLMHGEFPVACVFIDAPTDQVDVNIHPTKSQVKFLYQQDVFRAVQASIKSILETAPWIPKKAETTHSFLYQKNTETTDDHQMGAHSNVQKSVISDVQSQASVNSKITNSWGHQFDAELGKNLSQAKPKLLDDPAFQVSHFKKKYADVNLDAQGTTEPILKITDFEKSQFDTHLNANNKLESNLSSNSDLNSISKSSTSSISRSSTNSGSGSGSGSNSNSNSSFNSNSNSNSHLNSNAGSSFSSSPNASLNSNTNLSPSIKLNNSLSSEIIKDSIKQADVTKTNETRSYWGSLDVIGQAGLTYIVCQSSKGLILVDQHAAHERVVFEKLMRSMQSQKVEVQRFMIPLAIDLNEEKMEALRAHHEPLNKLGIEIEELGPTTIGITAAPAILKDSVLAKELDHFAQEIIDQGVGVSFDKIITDICASLACHSVVRAGQSLSIQEMKKLLEQMDEFPLSCYCPHGRPVSLDFAWSKLEKDFGRIV